MSPAITTIEGLREHLQGAIALEHATIPPYLCALYSIQPGTNTESSDIILSVMVEEMWHLMLAANLLNAVGGTPVLDDPDFIASYPACLPYSDREFQVPLARFSPETVKGFMRIEKPEESGAQSEADNFETIGQFYRAIEDGFDVLCSTLGEAAVFSGDPSRQITAEMVNLDPHGRVGAVRDLATAHQAIDEIEEQGEGLKHAEVWDGERDMFHPERDEVAHYFRFSQIIQGREYCRGDTPQSEPTGDAFEVNWSTVAPMRDNPRVADYPVDSPVRAAMEGFNQVYCDMLRLLHRTFNGETSHLGSAISTMMEVRDRARALMQLPSGDGATTAGPSFEYVPAKSAPTGDTPAFAISVRKDGPYVVSGGVPLLRKSIVRGEGGESMTWRREARVPADPEYRLCRCGHSSNKPFCDGTHGRIGFDGTENAPMNPSSERRLRFEGTKVTLTDDEAICASAAFCHNRASDVWEMTEASKDVPTRIQMMHMVEQCPSGRLVYELEDGPLEPDLPREISVTKDGPYWVTGGIEVTMSDGRTLEVRNRVTLCRCGQSSIKPLCDSSHNDVSFKDG